MINEIFDRVCLSILHDLLFNVSEVFKKHEKYLLICSLDQIIVLFMFLNMSFEA